MVRKLKVGDVVIVGSLGIGVVQRVTKNKIIIKNLGKFKKSNGRLVGSWRWCPLQISEGTEDAIKIMRDKINAKKVLARLDKIDMWFC